MLSNAYLVAKFRFDTAENEPAKNLQNLLIFPMLLTLQDLTEAPLYLEHHLALEEFQDVADDESARLAARSFLFLASSASHLRTRLNKIE